MKVSDFNLRDFSAGNNLIMNGDMAISQRGASFVAAPQGLTLDRWTYTKNGTMVHTISQDTDVPSAAEAGYLFTRSLRLTLTTPDDTVGASEYCDVRQSIEGYIYRRVVGKPFTLSFWVKATRTGTYAVGLRNSGSDRSLYKTYSINQSNTWEKKILVMPAAPLTGSWDYENGTGLLVRWPLIFGSDYQHASEGVWLTGNYSWPSSGGVNGVSSGSTDFRITGIMLNEGNDAQDFNLAGLVPSNELVLCKRYFERIGVPAGASSTRFFGPGLFANSTTGNFPLLYPVPKRANAVITFANPTTFRCNNATANYAVSAASYSNASDVSASIALTVAGAAANAPFTLDTLSTAAILIDAEL